MLVDVTIAEGAGSTFVAKIELEDHNTLHDAAELGFAEMLACLERLPNLQDGDTCESAALNRAVRGMIARVKSAKCNNVELFKYFDREDITVHNLDSATTPIVRKGLKFVLSPEDEGDLGGDEGGEPGNVQKPKAVRKLDDVLLGRDPASVKYMEFVPRAGNNTIDKQIKEQLYNLCENIKLGYCNTDQKFQLAANLQKLETVLCAVEMHWHKLLRADFPHVPEGDYKSSKLLEAVGMTSRAGKKA